jgi:hypothetical protein
MLLYYPEKFDANEWFILVGVIVNILVFTFLPKRLPRELIPLLVLLSISFPKVLDHTMAVQPYDFYNINDSKKYELFDLILYGVYPMFGYLFLYIFDIFKPTQMRFLFYILVWTFFAGAFEYILFKIHVFTYTGWHIVFSLPVYLITLCLTFLFYRFVNNYFLKNKRQSNR